MDITHAKHRNNSGVIYPILQLNDLQFFQGLELAAPDFKSFASPGKYIFKVVKKLLLQLDSDFIKSFFLRTMNCVGEGAARPRHVGFQGLETTQQVAGPINGVDSA